MIFAPALRNFTPRPRVRSIDWMRAHVSTHEGKPYDHGLYPHFGAPGGPCDALDDTRTLKIWLQFGSRLGKTFWCQAAMLCYAAVAPCPMMFASGTEKLATEVVQRTYGMLAHCPPLKLQLRPENRRRRAQIDLDDCRIYVGWSRSVSTLADKPARIGHGNEIDKWVHPANANEADPLKLFEERGKEFTRSKFLLESTPSVKGESRIERGRLGSTNCQYHVPCYHCHRYQRLRMGTAEEPGGLVWDHLSSGRSDKDLADRTARYVCEHCAAELLDQHRAWMLRRGVWAPDGCTVKDDVALAIADQVATVRRDRSIVPAAGGDGAELFDDLPYHWRGWSHAEWIEGQPVRDGRDAGYQLSSLNAVGYTWGKIAAEFVASKDSPEDLRNFINGWLADTWEIYRRKATWQQIGERLIDEATPRGVVPLWASLLTVGIDHQTAGGLDRWPFVVKAWGPGDRHATILYGEAYSLADLQKATFGCDFPHADGGAPLRPVMTLADSGNRTKDMYAFCVESLRAGFQVWPCKGSNRPLDTEYSIATLGRDTALPGMKLIHVDTLRTQAWMDRALHVVQPGDEGQFSIYDADVQEHQDYLEQLLNDGAITRLDPLRNEQQVFRRINTSIPNDFRDGERYAYIAKQIATRGAPVRPRASAPVVKRSAVISPGRTPEARW